MARYRFSQFFALFKPILIILVVWLKWVACSVKADTIATLNAPAPTDIPNKATVHDKKMKKKKQVFAKKTKVVQKSNVTKNLAVDVSSGVSAAKGIAATNDRYLPLYDIVQSLHLQIISDNKKGQMILTKGGVKVQFSSGQNYIIYQQSKIFLSYLIRFNNQKLLVHYDDYLRVLVPLLGLNLIPGKAPSLRTIVLDAGHGGKDPGAVNPRLNLFEKDINLQITKLLKVELVKLGFLVFETRATDIFVELGDRPRKADSADLYLSIHSNASTSTSNRGTEAFVLKRGGTYAGNSFDPWNLIAAYSILSAFVQETKLENRGLKMEDFAVLKSLKCPGVLVEIGFLSNDEEAKKLKDPVFQKKIVQGLVDGILKYQKNLQKKR